MSGRHVDVTVDKISRKMLDWYGDKLQFMCGKCQHLVQSVIPTGRMLYMSVGKSNHGHIVTEIYRPPSSRWPENTSIEEAQFARLCEQLILKRGKHVEGQA